MHDTDWGAETADDGGAGRVAQEENEAVFGRGDSRQVREGGVVGGMADREGSARVATITNDEMMGK